MTASCTRQLSPANQCLVCLSLPSYRLWSSLLRSQTCQVRVSTSERHSNSAEGSTQQGSTDSVLQDARAGHRAVGALSAAVCRWPLVSRQSEKGHISGFLVVCRSVAVCITQLLTLQWLRQPGTAQQQQVLTTVLLTCVLCFCVQCALPSSLHASSGWCVVQMTCSCVCTTTTPWTRSRPLRHTQTTSGEQQ